MPTRPTIGGDFYTADETAAVACRAADDYSRVLPKAASVGRGGDTRGRWSGVCRLRCRDQPGYESGGLRAHIRQQVDRRLHLVAVRKPGTVGASFQTP